MDAPQFATATATTTRTTRFRRIAQAAALFTAPWAFVLSNAGDAWMTRHGEENLTQKGALMVAAAHPDLDKWSIFAALVGCLLLVPAVLGAMNLVRYRAARLGLIGGVLMIAGYICYFGLCFQSYATIAMAQHGGASADHLAVLKLTQNQAFYVLPALTFVLGNVVGTVILGVALMRAHVIPRWAGICIVVWPVLHFIGGSWGEVAGAVLEAIGLAVVGLRVLHVSRTEELSGQTVEPAVPEPAL
jgi:hypothetical protein